MARSPELKKLISALRAPAQEAGKEYLATLAKVLGRGNPGAVAGIVDAYISEVRAAMITACDAVLYPEDVAPQIATPE